MSPHGFWLLIEHQERFVPFQEFPWFRDATIGQLTNVEMPSPQHLYWPDLDVDLAVDSLDHPDRYPLVSRERPDKPLQPSTRARRRPGKKRVARSARG